MSAILLGQVVFLSMFLMWKGKEEKMFGIMPEWVKAGMALSVLDAVLVMSFNTPNSFGLYEIYEDMDKVAEDIAKCLQSEKEEPIKIYLVGDGYDYWWADLHHRVYFDLIGSGIQVGNYVTDCVLIDNITREEFREKLLMEKYDYVYLVKGNDEFEQQFGSLFYTDMIEATLWEVNRENGMLELVQRFEQRLR